MEPSDREWRRGRADRAALLLDGANYFGALRSSLLAAEKRICLAGWDIDSRTPIRGHDAPEDGAPESLGALLAHLVERRPDLSVHVLLWDYSLLYAFEREPLPRLNLDWRTPKRVEACLDNSIPFGASHHEKIAIVDDRIAYCGGLDLTIRRWDRTAHEPDDPDRKDPNGEPYGPYHDVQMVVDGSAAGHLAELVRKRWNRAARSRLEPADTASDPWPAGVEPDLRDVDIGIVRTRPAYDDVSELRQVEAAYIDAIGQAERLVYIENQYLTAGKIAETLRRRLQERPALEAVIVSPRVPSGWLAAQTMGVGRVRFMKEFKRDDVAGRVAFLHPWVGRDSERVPVMVHAKLMVADDRLLHVGSSNLNNRSMGVDRECDLRIEAQTSGEEARVRDIRLKLLGHHLGLDAEQLADAERHKGSVIATIDEQDSGKRGLTRLEDPGADEEPPTELIVNLADPEKPLRPEEFIGDLFGALPDQPVRRTLLKLIVGAVVVAALLLTWRYSPLVDYVEPDRLAGLFTSVGDSRWAGPIVLAAFLIGSFLLFPVTALIAATAVALRPVEALAWAFAGALLAATANFGLGRLLPGHTLERWFGSWINHVSRRLRRGGIVSVMIVRNIPVAPFTVVNVVAGAARIPFRDYLIGTALGMAPGLAALTLLGDRLRGALQDPGWQSFALLGLAVLLWVGLAFGLQAISNRLANAR